MLRRGGHALLANALRATGAAAPQLQHACQIHASEQQGPSEPRAEQASTSGRFYDTVRVVRAADGVSCGLWFGGAPRMQARCERAPAAPPSRRATTWC